MADETHEMSNLENLLRAFEPAPARLDRDRLMYAAGQAAATRHGRSWASAATWRAVAALLLLTTIFQSVRLQHDRRAEVVQRSRPASAEPGDESPQAPRIADNRLDQGAARAEGLDQNMIAQRNLVLQQGIDAAVISENVQGPVNPIVTLGQLRSDWLSPLWNEAVESL
jgi:hypothetical protein